MKFKNGLRGISVLRPITETGKPSDPGHAFAWSLYYTPSNMSSVFR